MIICVCFFEFHCLGSEMLGFCIQNNFFEMLIIFIWITKQIAVHFKSIKLWFNFIMKCLKRLASVRLICTNFGRCLVFFNMSKIDRYGKWSDIQDLTTQEDKCAIFQISNVDLDPELYNFDIFSTSNKANILSLEIWNFAMPVDHCHLTIEQSPSVTLTWIYSAVPL